MKQIERKNSPHLSRRINSHSERIPPVFRRRVTADAFLAAPTSRTQKDGAMLDAVMIGNEAKGGIADGVRR